MRLKYSINWLKISRERNSRPIRTHQDQLDLHSRRENGRRMKWVSWLGSSVFLPRFDCQMREIRNGTPVMSGTHLTSRSHSFFRRNSMIARSWTVAASSSRCRAVVYATDLIFSPLSRMTTTWRSVADALPCEGNVLGMVMAGKKRKTVLVPILHHICFRVFVVKQKRPVCI